MVAAKSTIVRNYHELGLPKESANWIESREFFRLKVPIDKIPLVGGEVFASADNTKKIIIDKNVHKVGSTAKGYTPKVLVLCGSALVASAKEADHFTIDCWVGERALKYMKLDVRACAAFPGSVADLSQALNGLLKQGNGQKDYAYIRDIYPALGYFVYSKNNKLLKQAYSTNMVTLKISFTGPATQVYESYVTKPSQLTAGTTPVPNNPSDQHFNSAEGGFGTKAGLLFSDYRDNGAVGSELNSNFMSMMNIDEALSMYLDDLKDGVWKPVSSQWATVPPSLVDATNEASLLAKDKGLQSFAPLDFVKWQQKILASSADVKRVGDLLVKRSKFAYVGDPDDPSTWLLACATKETIKASLKQLKDISFIPRTEKDQIREMLMSQLA
jgi:hypothetical protein